MAGFHGGLNLLAREDIRSRSVCLRRGPQIKWAKLTKRRDGRNLEHIQRRLVAVGEALLVE